MRQRTVSDYFWRDPKLCNLSQEDKATLLFFLTAPESNIIGVYQVVWAVAGAEMGWTKDQLLVVARRLREKGLIDFKEDGWIIVKIWWEHNSAAGAFSPKLFQNAKKQCEDIPPEWLEEFLTRLDSLKLMVGKELNKVPLNRVSIGYSYLTDTVPPNTTTTACISKTTTTTSEIGLAPEGNYCNSELIYPQLSPNENIQVTELIKNFPLEVQQMILDEVAGGIQNRSIKRGVVPFTRGLISAAMNGKFEPSLGIAILDARGYEEQRKSQLKLDKSNLALNPTSVKTGEAMLALAAAKNKSSQSGNMQNHT